MWPRPKATPDVSSGLSRKLLPTLAHRGPQLQPELLGSIQAMFLCLPGLSLALPSHHRLPAFGVCFTCVSCCLGLPDVGNLHHSRCRDILPFCCCKQETNCTAQKTIHHFVITFPFQRLPFLSKASLWPKLPLINKRRTGRKMNDKEGEELKIGL